MAQTSLNSTGVASSGSLVLQTNGTTSAVTIDTSQNVGVGVTPSAWGVFKAIEIGSRGNSVSSYDSGGVYVNSNAYYNGSSWIYKISAPAAQYYSADGLHVWQRASSGTAGNAITFTQAMTLDASGNLGIGTTSPTQHFEISGTSTQYISAISTNGANAGIRMNSSGNRDFGIFSDGAMRFYDFTAAAERARIDSSGSFRINTTSNVYGSGEILSVRTTDGTGGTGAGIRGENSILLGLWNSTSGSTTLIGFSAGSGGAGVGSITTNGSTTLYNTTSDQRLKENILDADSASNLIDSLQVRKFDWKTNGSHQRYGFVAQELLLSAPEAVYQPEDTEQMMAVDYSKLVPMLVKEIQSLRQRVAQLESN